MGTWRPKKCVKTFSQHAKNVYTQQAGHVKVLVNMQYVKCFKISGGKESFDTSTNQYIIFLLLNLYCIVYTPTVGARARKKFSASTVSEAVKSAVAIYVKSQNLGFKSRLITKRSPDKVHSQCHLKLVTIANHTNEVRTV